MSRYTEKSDEIDSCYERFGFQPSFWKFNSILKYTSYVF